MSETKQYKKKTWTNFINTISYLTLAGCMTLALAACDNESQGPAEKAGEEIDETIQQIQTDAKDTKQAAEEKTEEFVNDAERAIEDATD